MMPHQRVWDPPLDVRFLDRIIGDVPSVRNIDRAGVYAVGVSDSEDFGGACDRLPASRSAQGQGAGAGRFTGCPSG